MFYLILSSWFGKVVKQSNTTTVKQVKEQQKPEKKDFLHSSLSHTHVSISQKLP